MIARLQRRVARLLWGASFVLTVRGAAPAHADQGRPVVVVSMADGQPVDPDLLGSMQELGNRVGVEVRPAWGGASWGQLQLSRSASGETELALTSAGQPALHRTVAASESESLRRETVAHVALAMLEAQREEVRDVSRTAPVTREPRADKVAAEPRPPHRLTLRGELSIGPVWVAARDLAPRVQGSLGLHSDRRLAPSLSLTLAGSFVPRQQSDDVVARLNLLSARVRPSVNVLTLTRLVLEVGTPLGFDVALASLPATRDDGELRTRRDVHVQPVLGALVAAHVPLTATLSLTLSAGVDLDLKPRAWAIGDADDSRSSLSLARLRPYLLAGASWGVAHHTR